MTEGMDARTMLTKARVRFLYESPFFANLSMYLNLRKSEEVPTAGVDFRGNLYYNEKWIRSLTFNEVKAVVAHETLHLALQHLLRCEGRKKVIWNFAIDFAVNSIILQENARIKRDNGSYEDSFKLVDGSLYSGDFENMSSEQIYDILIKKAKEIEKTMKTMDEHGYPIIGDKPSNKKSKAQKGREEELKITQEELRRQQKKWKRQLVEATTRAKQMGKLPQSIERLVDDFMDSKINWRGLLYRYITREIPVDLSYSRPHKKSISVGVYMPHVVKENVEIAVAIDTSGSISQEEFNEFMSEVVAIAKSSANICIHLIICDCRVKNTYEIRNGFDPSKVRIEGYGGTDFRPVYKWLEENKPDTRLLIYFTDGMGQYPHEERFKTVWVLPNDYDVPFGDKIIYRGSGENDDN